MEATGNQRDHGRDPAAASPRRVEIVRLGRIRYAEALALQESRRDEVLRGEAEGALFLLEHEPVFTLGRNASDGDVVAAADWLARQGIEIHESDRGGQVTYHGPGQLVGYPVLDLRPDRRDVRRYVRDLQEVLIRTLRHFGVAATGGSGETIGVWTTEQPARKIASIGIHLKRWVTTHGFALNVRTDLEHFSGIVACGLPDVRMTSLAELSGGDGPEVAEVAERVAVDFCDVFGAVPFGAVPT